MAHHNTILAQLMQLVCRLDFDRIERNGFRPRRRYRYFNRWGQLVAMIFAQMSGKSSLRDIAGQFRAQASKLYHLGVRRVCRSTLADANNRRPAGIFEAIFAHLYAKCVTCAPKKRFRFKNKLYSFDSTTIDLCLSLFPWAEFRRSKGGIKLHALLDHDGYIPAFVRMTEAKPSDIGVAKLLKLPPLSIVTFDRGYFDSSWFSELTTNKVMFVTRMKRNILYRVEKRRTVLKDKGLTCDQTVVLKASGKEKNPVRLRRIGYRDPETGKHYVFLTNIFHLAAATIAEIYRDRWQVELFFKWIKQNLKIKSFLGTSRNAVMTQIWVALITLLLMAYLKFKSKLGESLSRIRKLLQLNLFSRRDLLELLHPDSVVPPPQNGKQLCLFFNHL
jgi:putative transposase